MRVEKQEKEQVLVSACCLGLRCRYHGRKSVVKAKIKKLMERYHLVPVCPEQLGGLPTPRPAAYWMSGCLEFVQRRNSGCWQIVQATLPETARLGSAYRFYEDGAEETLRIAELLNIKKAYFLKDSPSCDPKKGICSKLLRRNGLRVLYL